MSTTVADELLYQSYRALRNAGTEHAEIKASGAFPECEAYCLRYDLAVGNYADAMRKRDQAEPPRRRDDDCDTFGRQMGEGT